MIFGWTIRDVTHQVGETESVIHVPGYSYQWKTMGSPKITCRIAIQLRDPPNLLHSYPDI